MLKLYRTRFTAKQLRALASHCYSFCPEGSALNWCKAKECEFWPVCCDFQRLATYAANLASEQEATAAKN